MGTVKFSNVDDNRISEYLIQKFGGKIMYIPVDNKKCYRRTRADTISLLRKSGYSDKNICKVMGIFPSTINRLLNSNRRHDNEKRNEHPSIV